MGGNDRKADNEDNKRKKKKKQKTHSDSEEDDRRTKRHRTERDERDKSKKRKHHSDKEKKSKEKRKRKHNKHGDQSKLQIQELTSDDYFSKNNEFATWLKEEKGMFFSDLASDSARKFFSEFVEEWNSKKLESRYYEGIATGPRTAHKWKIRQ